MYAVIFHFTHNTLFKMCFLESQCCLNAVILFQDFVRTHLTEETMMSNHTDVIDHGEILPASHLLQ